MESLDSVPWQHPPLGLASDQKQYFFPKQNKIPEQGEPEGSRKAGSKQQEKKTTLTTESKKNYSGANPGVGSKGAQGKIVQGADRVESSDDEAQWRRWPVMVRYDDWAWTSRKWTRRRNDLWWRRGRARRLRVSPMQLIWWLCWSWCGCHRRLIWWLSWWLDRLSRAPSGDR